MVQANNSPHGLQGKGGEEFLKRTENKEKRQLVGVKAKNMVGITLLKTSPPITTITM